MFFENIKAKKVGQPLNFNNLKEYYLPILNYYLQLPLFQALYIFSQFFHIPINSLKSVPLFLRSAYLIFHVNSLMLIALPLTFQCVL
jgi:hypothetical protein